MPPLPTPPTTAETARLTKLVLQCHAGQQLYLLGTTAVSKRTSSVFNNSQPGCHYTAHYFLLSLVALEPPGLPALQDKIENTLATRFIPCTVLVLHLHTFNRWLAEGHPFATTIIGRAELLHDNGFEIVDPSLLPAHRSRLTAESSLLTAHRSRLTADSSLLTAARQRKLAREFMDGAQFYRQKGNNSLSAFMLHQCAEQCLRCLLLTTTGYEPHTHNIDKLVRYCSMTVHKVGEIFNTHNAENKRVYGLLRRAYTEARYTLFPVMDVDLAVMMGKVQALRQLVKDCCKDSL